MAEDRTSRQITFTRETHCQGRTFAIGEHAVTDDETAGWLIAEGSAVDGHVEPTEPASTDKPRRRKSSKSDNESDKQDS